MVQSRTWILTINNPTDGDLANWSEGTLVGQHRIVGYIAQQEVGENGTPHVQACVRFERAVRLGHVKRVYPRAHAEAARDALRAAAYCRKDDTRVAGPWIQGDISWSERAAGRTSMWQRFAADVAAGKQKHELVDDYAYIVLNTAAYDRARALRAPVLRDSHPQVYVFYGPTGTGKTRAVYAKEDYARLYVADAGDNLKWWDGYDWQTHESVLLDDFRGSVCKPHRLLVLTDRYPVRVQFKGGYTFYYPQRVYITSNVAPWDWYINVDHATRQALARRLTHIYEARSDVWVRTHWTI